MEGTEYKTKEAVLRKAQEAIGIPMKEIDKTGRLNTGKGAIGTVLEESWFGYTPNSESEPDFPEAGIELKATPYLKTRSGIRAKERLVCNIINYMTEYKKTFETSDFWHKCETLLIMSYEHKSNVGKGDFTIDKAILFSYPTEDLIIIEQDWQKIMDKIKAGQAHLITEGDTLYLAACTKGATSASVREQPFSPIPAKQRAYSLKSSYMTRVLNSYIFGTEEDEHIIKDWHVLADSPFEEIIIERLKPNYGRTVTRLCTYYGLATGAKNVNELLLSKMLGIEGRASQTNEFQNANIVPKTLRIQKNGTIKESMSFPTFKFTEIIKEEWETSELRELLEPAKFMFVIFKENASGEYVFERVMFWNMPAQDLEEVRKVWERTVKVIKEGVKLTYDGGVTRNNLPKQSENRVAHVRPHGKNSNDTYPLPDGRRLTKQCFWLNRTYIEDVIKSNSAAKKYTYSYPEPSPMKVAETQIPYSDKSKVIPCGAYVKHKTFGKGQITTIMLSFDNRPIVNYPYLVGKRDEFDIMPDGITVFHERFGRGSVVGYKVVFESVEMEYLIDGFNNGEIELVPKMESE